jgi:hypothetical protein
MPVVVTGTGIAGIQMLTQPPSFGGIFSTSANKSFKESTATMFPTRALLGRSVWKGKLPVSIPRLFCHPLPKISR